MNTERALKRNQKTKKNQLELKNAINEIKKKKNQKDVKSRLGDTEDFPSYLEDREMEITQPQQ